MYAVEFGVLVWAAGIVPAGLLTAMVLGFPARRRRPSAADPWAGGLTVLVGGLLWPACGLLGLLLVAAALSGGAVARLATGPPR